MRGFLYFTILMFFYSLNADAIAPVNACRVKKETLEKHSLLVNNAGCVITKTENETVSFLMVLNNNSKSDRGWAFPGGKTVNLKNDSKEKSKLKIPKKPTYAEPAVCTASRETREEIGSEVIVEDLVEIQKYFIDFFYCVYNLRNSITNKKRINCSR